MKKQGADVVGAKAGAKPSKPYIQQDTAGSTQVAEVVYGLGDGENGGLINGLNSIILDGTRIVGDSGEVNFNEVKYEERYGLIDQAPLTLIEDTATERTLGVEVRDAAPAVTTFSNIDVDKYVVRISIPQLMQNKDNGDSVATSVTYSIDVSVAGGAYQTLLTNTVTEKITNGYEIDHELDAPEGTGTRTFRVRRVTSESTSQLLVNKIYLAAVTEIVAAKFSHPTLHHIGLTFNAEQFNNMPKVVFHYYGRKIKVPSNYDPKTRTYSGIWNGTFKVVYSNNPAWVLFDIITDRRSGLGRRIPMEMIDKWELYRIGMYCDELVPDGKGGMEPRFECNNLVLNSRQDAFQVLKDIASIFRGQSFWNGSQVVTVADAPRDVDYAISMASVISYSYSGTSRQARHNVVKVQYYDKTNDNAAAYEYATDYDSIRETEDINEVEIRAFGCTSAGQAQRLARYTLLSEQTETRILTAKIAMDGFVNMQLGDVFAWSDKFLAGANNGGRIVAASGKTVTLDRDVTGSALVGDTLFVNTSSGKATTRKITAIAGNKLTVDVAIENVESEYVWVIDSAELSLLYFKLDDYKVNPTENTVEIVGIQHVNGKFSTVDSETALEAPTFTKVEIETLRAPGNVTTNYNVRIDQGINKADIYVAWGQVKGATKYTVEFRRDDQAWRILGTVTGVTHTIEDVSAGIYEVRVRAADSIGNLSPFGYSAALNVQGAVLPPPKLASFTATGKLLAIDTAWTFPAGVESSLAVVIEQSLTDPSQVGGTTQKINIPYPQTAYTFSGLGAHTKLWLRAAIVDKYNQVGEYSVWVNATADANPEALLDLISGHINEGTLDQALKGKIDGAMGLATDANALAGEAKTAAANAQADATAAATKATAAAAAAAKEATDRAAAITAEATARTNAINKEATDRAAALTAQSTTLKADSAAKVSALKSEIDPKIATLQNGITTLTTDYKAGDTAVVGQLNAYKASNDTAVASVVQKAESAVATGATNSTAITAINGQITNINNNKLDASVITGYYTKGQTDAKAAEIAAGKVEEFSANLKIGGVNLLYDSALTDRRNWVFGIGSGIAGTAEVTLLDATAVYTITNAKGVSDVSLKQVLRDLSMMRGDTLTSSFTLLEMQGDFRIESKVQFRYKDSSYASSPITAVVPQSTGRMQFEVKPPVSDKEVNEVQYWITVRPLAVGSSARVVLHKPQLEVGSVATDWSPSPLDTKASLDANSTAIQTTDAEVRRVDGKIDATNSAVTALTGRVSTVEGAVSTKAEAAALNALTTRVVTEEGKSTSQGTAITNLQNTINHATTGLATKASTSALNATNSEVTRVNGLVTGHTSQLTALNTSITTINGELSKKADASALNNIYTKAQTDAKATEISAGKVEEFKAGLSIGGSNLLNNSNFAASASPDAWASNGGGYTKVDDATYGEVLQTNLPSGIVHAWIRLENATEYTYSALVKSSLTIAMTNSNPLHYHAGLNNVNQSKISIISRSHDSLAADTWTRISITFKLTGDADSFRPFIYASGSTGNIQLAWAKLERGNQATDWSPSSTDTIATLGSTGTNLFKADMANVRDDTVANARLGNTTASYWSVVTEAEAASGKAVKYAPLTKPTNTYTEFTPLNKNASFANYGTVSLKPATYYMFSFYARLVTNPSNGVFTFGLTLNYQQDAGASDYIRHLAKRGNLSLSSADLGNRVRIYGIIKTTARTEDAKRAIAYIHTNMTQVSSGVVNIDSFMLEELRGYEDGVQSQPSSFDSSSYEAFDSAAATASSLDTLTSRVSNAEGTLTSVGTRTTALENSVNNTTSGLASKASSSALTVVDNKVTAANGRIDTTSSAVTTLTGRVSVAEGELTKKATTQALDALTSRVSSAEGTLTSVSSRTTSLENAINHSTTGLATKAAASALTTLNNQVQHSTTGLSAVNTKVDNLKATIENSTNGLASKASSSALDTLSNKVNHSTTGLDAVANKTTALESELSYASAKKSFILATNRNGGSTTGFMGRGVYDEKKSRLAALTRGLNLIIWSADGAMQSCTQYDTYAGVAACVSLAAAIDALAANTYFTVIGVDNVGTVITTHVALRSSIVNNGGSDSYFDQWKNNYLPIFTSKKGMASGAAIQHSFNSSVTNDWIHYLLEFVAGIPVGLAGATPIDESKFATASAVSDLTTRVTTAEGNVTSQGQSITALQNTINHSTNGLASKASSSALDTLSNKVNHSTTGLDAVANKTTALESNVTSLVDVTTITDTRSTDQPPQWYRTNYPKKSTKEFKTQTVIGVNGFFSGTYCTLETTVPFATAAAGATVIQTATSSADPSLYVQRFSTGTIPNETWSTWAQPVKDLRDSLASKAAASAVESLTTRVSTAEGKITAEATKVSNLTTTVGGHTTTIASQTSSINGIRGVHTFKMDTNGVISGYGLISEVINGVVKSQFGINANNFFIGAPSNNKKPFVVLTTSGVINGVTVPAGTYIDTAFIGTATIKTAHIGDAAITNAKIGGAIQSNDYVVGKTGWKIDKAGGFEMNGTGTLGSVQVKAGGVYGFYANGKPMFKLGI